MSPEFFRVFAVEPVIGHAFSPEELKLGEGALLISYSFWQSRFDDLEDLLKRMDQ